MAVSEHDGMRHNSEGYQLTVHVRLMHALVNHRFEGGDRWDTARWGIPINQSDQAATLGLFSATLLLGVRSLGVRVTPEDSEAVMHLWKYVGWLMGVNDDWLFDSERDQHVFNYHILLAQDDISEAGPQLAHGILEAQKDLNFKRFPRLGRAYTRARLLSMLRPFLTKEGVRDLELPVRLPWASVGVFGRNIVTHQILGRTGWGRRRLHTQSAKARDTIMYRHFGPDTPEIGNIAA